MVQKNSNLVTKYFCSLGFMKLNLWIGQSWSSLKARKRLKTNMMKEFFKKIKESFRFLLGFFLQKMVSLTIVCTLTVPVQSKASPGRSVNWAKFCLASLSLLSLRWQHWSKALEASLIGRGYFLKVITQPFLTNQSTVTFFLTVLYY